MEPTNEYMIQLIGCDDATIVILDLTAAEISAIAALAVAVNDASTSNCMPTMKISGANDEQE